MNNTFIIYPKLLINADFTQLCGFRHVAAEGSPADMWSNFRHLHLLNLVVLLSDMLKIFLPVKCHHRSSVLIQKQEATVSVHHWLNLWIFPICENILEAFFDFRYHWHHAHTFCFGILNYIFHISGSLKLMIYDNSVILKINVFLCQPDKLKDTKSCLKQDIDTIMILPYHTINSTLILSYILPFLYGR